MKSLIVFGISSYAEIVAEYFERDGAASVCAFSVDREHRTASTFRNRPVFDPEDLVREFDPQETYFHVAATYTNLNRLRRDKVAQLCRLGFRPLSYVSPAAYVDPTAAIGEHVFIFENNTIQPFVRVGNRTILWSGNHIGHHTLVEDDVFVSSQVVISGHCTVGPRSFLGVNSTIGHGVKVGADNWIQPGTVLLSDTGDNQMWRPQRPVMSGVSPIERFVSD